MRTRRVPAIRICPVDAMNRFRLRRNGFAAPGDAAPQPPGIITHPQINHPSHMPKISPPAASSSRLTVAEEDTSPRPSNIDRSRTINDIDTQGPKKNETLHAALPRRPAQVDPDVQQAAETLFAISRGTKG